MDDVVWVPTVFSTNRERLIKHDAVIEFFNEVLAIAQKKDRLSGVTALAPLEVSAVVIVIV
jgi:hypothetical protein